MRAAKQISAIAISEPGAGGDPAAMNTRAVRDGDDWVINGRKIWVSRVPKPTSRSSWPSPTRPAGARGGISAFLVDKGTPGFNLVRQIPMIGGAYTYEIVLEDCRCRPGKLLGQEGHGFRADAACGFRRGASRWRRGASACRNARST